MHGWLAGLRPGRGGLLDEHLRSLLPGLRRSLSGLRRRFPGPRRIRRGWRGCARLLDEFPLGFVAFDTGQRCTYLNRAGAELVGCGTGELIGRTPQETFSAGWREPLAAAVSRVLATGDVEVGVVRAAAGAGPDRELLTGGYPTRSRDGEVDGVVVALLDVTGRWSPAGLAQEDAGPRATAELVAKYEAAQEIAALGTWEADLDENLTWSRQTYEIIGLTEPYHGVEEFSSYVHPDDRAVVFDCYQRMVELHEPFHAGIRLVRPDGRVVYADTTGRVVRDDAGAVVGYWGTIQDITELITTRAARRDALRAAEVARAELAVEHATLQIVQRAMLPASVPEVPGVELAVAYRPVADAVDIGGDWYDAFTLPDGRLAVTVGDVAGHDLRAATAMGQVRNALRAYATEHGRPGWVLHRTNELLMASDEPELVTAVYGVFDPVTFQLTFARAGHPPPLLRTGGHTTEQAEPRGIALGATPLDQPYLEATVTLAPGDAVLLYTDGLVERRGRDTLQDVQRLCALVDGVPARAHAEEIVRAVTAGFVDTGPTEDDMCLLVLHRPVAGTAAGDRRPPAAGAHG